jgi:hypothetical protein
VCVHLVADTIVVTETGSSFEPGWCSGCTVIRDGALNTATTTADLQWIAVTIYATASLPVWTVNFGASPRRIYLFEWASDGALSASPDGDSVCVLNDVRVFDETIPWADTNTPSASFTGDPHIVVRDRACLDTAKIVSSAHPPHTQHLVCCILTL